MEARTRSCRLAAAVLCRRVAASAAETATVDSVFALWPACPLHPPPGWTPPRLPGGRRGGTGSGVPVRVGQPPRAGVGPSRVRRVPGQVVGVLPAGFVAPPGRGRCGWASPPGLVWYHPAYAEFLARLSSFSRLILFDRLGNGLSDRGPTGHGVEDWMDDARSVMAAAGSARAAF